MNSKIIISMNVPDPKRFCQAQSVFMTRQNSNFNVVYFGTITQRLGIDLAIHAVKNLVDQIPGIRLHIIGDGEDKQKFRHMSEALNLEGVVNISENIYSLEELIPILCKMDLCIIPNRRNEATELMLPVKMIESIALGIPVVVPKLEAIQHYLSKDMAYFFEPDDVGSMAQAIAAAFEDVNNRFNKARNARKFLNDYAWETHKHVLLNAYHELTTI